MGSAVKRRISPFPISFAPLSHFEPTTFLLSLDYSHEISMTFPSLYESIVNGAAISTKGLQWLAQKRLLALQKLPRS